MGTKLEAREEASGGGGSILRRCGILTLISLVCFAAAGPLAFHLSGTIGFLAASGAMLVCLVCGLLAMLVTEPLRQPQLVMHHVLVSTAIRTGIPLMVVMLIYFRPGPIARAGFVYYLLAFYMVTLLVETGLAVQSHKVGANGPAKVS